MPGGSGRQRLLYGTELISESSRRRRQATRAQPLPRPPAAAPTPSRYRRTPATPQARRQAAGGAVGGGGALECGRMPPRAAWSPAHPLLATPRPLAPLQRALSAGAAWFARDGGRSVMCWGGRRPQTGCRTGAPCPGVRAGANWWGAVATPGMPCFRGRQRGGAHERPGLPPAGRLPLHARTLPQPLLHAAWRGRQQGTPCSCLVEAGACAHGRRWRHVPSAACSSAAAAAALPAREVHCWPCRSSPRRGNGRVCSQ